MSLKVVVVVVVVRPQSTEVNHRKQGNSMGLETSFSYISTLNTEFPVNTDPLSETDNHLRGIKTAVKQSFPSVSGAVTLDHTELNKRTALVSDGASSAAVSLNTGVTQAAAKTALGVSEPALSISGSTLSIDSGTTAADIRTAISAVALSDLTILTALDIYPIGAIYLSVVSTDPSTYFGGTWVRVGEGRMLVGHSTTDSTFEASSNDFSTQNTGGATSKTLSVSEMPAHSHHLLKYSFSDGNDFGGAATGNDNISNDPDTQNLETNSVGSGASFSLMNPYLVVFMWRRTA